MPKPQVEAHIYFDGEDTPGHCWVCHLPEGNKAHNTRPIRINPRTKREEYTDR